MTNAPHNSAEDDVEMSDSEGEEDETILMPGTNQTQQEEEDSRATWLIGHLANWATDRLTYWIAIGIPIICLIVFVLSLAGIIASVWMHTNAEDRRFEELKQNLTQLAPEELHMLSLVQKFLPVLMDDCRRYKHTEPPITCREILGTEAED